MHPVTPTDTLRIQDAFAEIERLFDAVPRTPEGDRLDILALLVENYEEQHHEIPPPDPVSAREYYRESRGHNLADI